MATQKHHHEIDTPRARPPKDDRTDDQLMMACAGGDQAAFRILVRRHQRAALACALARCRGNMVEAQDIVQEAFLSVYKSAARYQPQGRFLQYLCTIVRNHHNQLLRKLKRYFHAFDDMHDSCSARRPATIV